MNNYCGLSSFGPNGLLESRKPIDCIDRNQMYSKAFETDRIIYDIVTNVNKVGRAPLNFQIVSFKLLRMVAKFLIQY